MVSIYKFLYDYVATHNKNFGYLKPLQLNKREHAFVEERANTLYSIVWLAVILETIRRYTYTTDINIRKTYRDEIENFKTGISTNIGLFGKTGEFQEKFINRILRPLLCIEGYVISKLDKFKYGKTSGVISLLTGESSDVLNKKHPRYLIEIYKDIDNQKFLLSRGFNETLYNQTRDLFTVKKLNLEVKKVNKFFGKNPKDNFKTQRLFLLRHLIKDCFLPHLDYVTLANLVIYYALEKQELNGILRKNRRRKKELFITIREFYLIHLEEYNSMKTRYIIQSYYASSAKEKLI
jgi:hypothetical protein